MNLGRVSPVYKTCLLTHKNIVQGSDVMYPTPSLYLSKSTFGSSRFAVHSAAKASFRCHAKKLSVLLKPQIPSFKWRHSNLHLREIQQAVQSVST
jgi:hypothetical protein